MAAMKQPTASAFYKSVGETQTTMVTTTGSTIVVCLAACAVLVLCEYRGWKLAKVLLKILASTAFLALALQLDATASAYGQLILVGLGLGWVGDVLLLSQKSQLFLLGLASFLLAHVAYAIAFASLPFASTTLAIAFAVMGCLGIAVIAWLWRYLKAFYRVAVVAYVIAIFAMCALAIAASAASRTWPLAVGAVMFAISDIAVARNRFVAPGASNKLWGLPLYYVAQIILASSVAGVQASAG
ncbi:MAG: lysoplasmalogenase [Stenotrophomonas sp.]|jgi:uncharacterized membrane protein YhhN|nr:MAG: lysoplasmalogenase [Stenotrophomonas sp.]